MVTPRCEPCEQREWPCLTPACRAAWLPPGRSVRGIPVFCVPVEGTRCLTSPDFSATRPPRATACATAPRRATTLRERHANRPRAPVPTAAPWSSGTARVAATCGASTATPVAEPTHRVPASSQPVKRERCSADRRGLFAVLTDEGLAKLREASPTHLAGVRSRFLTRLSADEQTSLGALWERLVPGTTDALRPLARRPSSTGSGR